MKNCFNRSKIKKENYAKNFVQKEFLSEENIVLRCDNACALLLNKSPVDCKNCPTEKFVSPHPALLESSNHNKAKEKLRSPSIN